ncbi:hypothetical protein [Streptomyces sp. CoH17]|uniref:hypothetical protein n=1 Tax=Streptomyces sp. CoH17 TaxID=2992806 RepID=UPI00227078A5|nr:hypothetical protein [Streptomyces sp. CoH17]
MKKIAKNVWVTTSDGGKIVMVRRNLRCYQIESADCAGVVVHESFSRKSAIWAIEAYQSGLFDFEADLHEKLEERAHRKLIAFEETSKTAFQSRMSIEENADVTEVETNGETKFTNQEKWSQIIDFITTGGAYEDHDAKTADEERDGEQIIDDLVKAWNEIDKTVK